MRFTFGHGIYKLSDGGNVDLLFKSCGTSAPRPQAVPSPAALTQPLPSLPQQAKLAFFFLSSFFSYFRVWWTVDCLDWLNPIKYSYRRLSPVPALGNTWWVDGGFLVAGESRKFIFLGNEEGMGRPRASVFMTTVTGFVMLIMEYSQTAENTPMIINKDCYIVPRPLPLLPPVVARFGLASLHAGPNMPSALCTFNQGLTTVQSL